MKCYQETRNWNDLSEVSKIQLDEIRNCFCKLRLQAIILP